MKIKKEGDEMIRYYNEHILVTLSVILCSCILGVLFLLQARYDSTFFIFVGIFLIFAALGMVLLIRWVKLKNKFLKEFGYGN